MERIIIDYELVEEFYLGNVTKSVKELIKEGWQPFGGLIEIDEKYVQAVVKYEESSSPIIPRQI